MSANQMICSNVMGSQCAPVAGLGVPGSEMYQFPPNSPVSPRVKSIKDDMEALIISRQDNPFLTHRLELLSSCGDGDLSSSSDLSSFSPQRHSENIEQDASQSLLAMEEDFETDNAMHHIPELLDGPDLDLHERLIRSPPPQFPTNLSNFLFPGPGSPLRSANLKQQMLSPSKFSNSERSGTPEISLLRLVTPAPAGHPTTQGTHVLWKPIPNRYQRRGSHPADEDSSPSPPLPPLLPPQRARSGPVALNGAAGASAFLCGSHRQRVASMNVSGSREALLGDLTA